MKRKDDALYRNKWKRHKNAIEKGENSF